MTSARLDVLGRNWKNWHGNITATPEASIVIHQDNVGISTVAAYREVSDLVARHLTEAQANNRRVRAIGSRWSLSTVAVSDGDMLETTYLNMNFVLNGRQLDPRLAADRDTYWLAQCGSNIGEVNRTIEAAPYRRSLRTSGAANGQTVAGAASANTHGSTLGFGSFHDQIVGLHLITGEGRQYWLERNSQPVVSQDFVDLFGLQLLRDDAMFNAALVSFGSFGFIMGVLLETRPRFLLRARNHKLPLDKSMWSAMSSRNFVGLDPKYPDRRPYFAQVTLNPMKAEHAYLTVMFEETCGDDYEPDYRWEEGKYRPGYDALSAIGLLADQMPVVSAGATEIALDHLHAMAEASGTYGEIFGFAPSNNRSCCSSFGIPLDHVEAATKMLFDIGAQSPAPVAVHLRYAERSPALMAFTRFAPTAIFSLDGVESDAAQHYFRKVWERLRQDNIPHAYHWGKSAPWTPGQLAATHGDDLDTWRSLRKSLLNAREQACFSSPFTDGTGLTP